MSELLGGQIGVGDFIFAHRKGKIINFESSTVFIIAENKN